MLPERTCCGIDRAIVDDNDGDGGGGANPAASWIDVVATTTKTKATPNDEIRFIVGNRFGIVQQRFVPFSIRKIKKATTDTPAVSHRHSS